MPILRHLFAAVLVALAGSAASSPARAHDLCDQASTPEQGVSVCTQQIESGQHKGRDLAIAHVNRGVAYYRLKQYGKAVADFDRAIGIAPGLHEALINRGAARLAQGRVDQAIADYSRAIALAPGAAGAWYGRGAAHERAGRRAAAIHDYRRYVKLAPHDPDGPAALKRLGAK
jgi:tetratricopeptide (TPR) repeat protein